MLPNGQTLHGTLSTLALGVYISKVSKKTIGMSLTRTVWVKLNQLPTGVGRFGSSMVKWGLVSSTIYECGASNKLQTTLF